MVVRVRLSEISCIRQLSGWEVINVNSPFVKPSSFLSFIIYLFNLSSAIVCFIKL